MHIVMLNVYTQVQTMPALPSHLSPDYFVVFDRRKLSALSVETSINGSTGSRPLSPRFRETRAFVSTLDCYYYWGLFDKQATE